MWLIWTTVPALQSDFRAADVLYANAALQGIDLQGHPDTWLSPGIDVDTSGMSAPRACAASCQTHPGNGDQSGQYLHMPGDADCGTHSQVARPEPQSPGGG
jgi:hypothetical protein